MILNTAIEKGQINGKKAVRTGAQGAVRRAERAREYAKLDKVCQTLLAVGLHDQGRRRPARAYPGSASQWPSELGRLRRELLRAASRSSRRRPSRGTVFNRP